MQQHSKLVSSASCDDSFLSEDYLAPDKTSRSTPEMGGLEKTIYVHVICVGEYSPEEIPYAFSRFVNATNDWYVIKRGSDGCLKMSRVFEGIKQFNHPGPALDCTGCQVIGSCIYVIGGQSNLSQLAGCPTSEYGSNLIRCLDTRNPRKGWMTLPVTLPFPVSEVGCVVVDDQWLYLLGGFYNFGSSDWGTAVNVTDVNGHGNAEKHKSRSVVEPGDCSVSPIVSTSFSPGTLVCYMEREHTLYHLDCTKNAWTVYEKDLPYTPSRLLGGASVSDGILYIYDSYDMQFISYDIPNRKQLYLLDLPNSGWLVVNKRSI